MIVIFLERSFLGKHSADEKGAEMTLINVLCDLFGDDGFVAFQKVKISVSFFGGELERDMKQLSDIGVEALVRGDVANSGGHLGA